LFCLEPSIHSYRTHYGIVKKSGTEVQIYLLLYEDVAIKFDAYRGLFFPRCIDLVTANEKLYTDEHKAAKASLSLLLEEPEDSGRL